MKRISCTWKVLPLPGDRLMKPNELDVVFTYNIFLLSINSSILEHGFLQLGLLVDPDFALYLLVV